MRLPGEKFILSRLLGGHEMPHGRSGARCYTPCDIVVMVPNGFLRQKKKKSHPAFIFVTLNPEPFCARCFIEPQALFPEGPGGAKALWAQLPRSPPGSSCQQLNCPPAPNPRETRDLVQGDVLRVLWPAGSGSRAGKTHSDFVN